MNTISKFENEFVIIAYEKEKYPYKNIDEIKQAIYEEHKINEYEEGLILLKNEKFEIYGNALLKASIDENSNIFPKEQIGKNYVQNNFLFINSDKLSLEKEIEEKYSEKYYMFKISFEHFIRKIVSLRLGILNTIYSDIFLKIKNLENFYSLTKENIICMHKIIERSNFENKEELLKNIDNKIENLIKSLNNEISHTKEEIKDE